MQKVATVFIIASLGLGNSTNASSPEISGWTDVNRFSVELVSEIIEFEGSRERATTLVTHRKFGFTRSDQLYFFSGHDDKPLGEDWQREPYNVEKIINRDTLFSQRHFLRAYGTTALKHKSMPRAISSDALCFVLPVWLPKGLPIPGDNIRNIVFVIDDAIASEHYSRLDERRIINEIPCIGYMQQDELDVIWVDPQRPKTVMAREWYLDDDKTMRYSLTTTEVAEVADGIHIPIKFDVRFFGRGEVTPETIRRSRVVDVRLNDDVPVSMFEPKPRKGSIKLQNEGFLQTHPGGEDLIEDVASLIKRKMPVRSPDKNNALLNARLALAFSSMFMLGWLICRDVSSRLRRRQVFLASMKS